MQHKQFPEPVVGAFIFNDEGKILLLKEEKFHDQFVPPGGHIEMGETFDEALQREVLEETNLTIDNIQLMALQDVILPASEARAARHFVYIGFCCTTRSKEVVLNEESQDSIWILPEESLKLPLHPYTRSFITEYLLGDSSTCRTTLLYNYHPSRMTSK